jgi:hypothetical protein
LPEQATVTTLDADALQIIVIEENLNDYDCSRIISKTLKLAANILSGRFFLK